MPELTTFSGLCVSATFKVTSFTPTIPYQAPKLIIGIEIMRWITGIEKLISGDKFKLLLNKEILNLG
jgi:hypothetical protein